MWTLSVARSSCRVSSLANGTFNPTRNIALTTFNRESFKIQDAKDFDAKVRNSKVPVIVDFFATWCNPCRMLTPRLEAVIAEHEGKINLAKVDIDENTDLALDYEVGSVPVLLAIRNGKVEERLIGLQDADKLRKWIEQVIVRDGHGKN